MKRRQPFVSIVIPTLRRPNYLRSTLISALKQTYSPLEVIVSDNGSGDNTPEIVAEFAEGRLRFRKNLATVWMPTHINQCLDEAKGEYVCILCDDDLISTSFIESFVDLFEKYPKAVVGLSRCETIDAEGRVSESFGLPSRECGPGSDFVLDWLWGRKAVLTPTFISMFMRTEMVRELGGWPLTDPLGSNADNAVFLALALQGDVAFAADAVFQYRVYLSSYGLSMPLSSLLQSSLALRQYLDNNPVMRRSLDRLSQNQADLVRRGISRMLARQYLGRVRDIYLPKMNATDFARALLTYRFDAEYLRAIPGFLFSLPRFGARKRQSIN